MALVLVIDQSFDSLVYLSELFETKGIECRLATSWKMALEHLLIESFDFILCEHCMDEGDAFWFLRHLKALKTSSRYIVMSDDMRIKKKIPLENFTIGFCSKPICWDDLWGEMQ